MIHKLEGSYLLNKLRVIHLFEADYNGTIGLLFNRKLLYNAEHNNPFRRYIWWSLEGHIALWEFVINPCPAGKYNEIIGKIRQHKEKPPLPGDVMKAVATQQNETISYSTAWRSIAGVERLQLQQQILSFQLIIPNLQRLSRDNPESKIDREKYPNTQRIRRLLVCPGFMNETIKSVLPVISLDGAHMDSKWKGTLLTASALSPNRKLYLIAFTFTEGNEDHQTWDFCCI